MRAFIASTVGAASIAALVLPSAVSPAGALSPPDSGRAVVEAPVAAPETGGTQSLALGPLGGGGRTAGADAPAAGAVGLEETDVDSFSLLGVVWSDAAAELAGEAEVRTRSSETGEWSQWEHLHATAEHGPDPGTAEEEDRALAGGTEPLWVGDSDGVQVRVVPDGTGRSGAELPAGLRLELIDPGEDPAAGAPDAGAEEVREERSGAPTSAPDGGEGLDGEGGTAPGPAVTEDSPEPAEEADPRAEADVQLLAAPRPGVVTRSRWGADESWREGGFAYTDAVKTVFVHHTAGGNGYACSEAPSVIRGIYRYHTQSQGWRDIGYNFLVDKCGTIYEGRAGGVERAVLGAHTYGFNHNSMGVAVLGTHSSTDAPAKVTNALAQLSGWKLRAEGRNPAGTWKRVSAGGKYAKGTVVTMHNISGHRDGFSTDCPGSRLYNQLPAIRKTAAAM
ncbi:peptidoglycan recognition protein family protein [Streptomyces lonarensis]|uniref:Peptidoglycan recognition protein n=1 Tax=Streptomyces lonarensis TaxID=700599 RepID=A0A7X6CYK9_9ACTN|nr:N-acetylmuramoyl-L-alanine amidase [Streptomyces lonarensis]NJQ04865.1 peptidoglycan recognition protein [Streptomyces lonarensis]